jgi:hypothetical protein
VPSSLKKKKLLVEGGSTAGLRIIERVRFPAGDGNFSLYHRARTAVGPAQPLIHWVPGALSVGVKRQGREADHSPPSSAEVKE